MTTLRAALAFNTNAAVADNAVREYTLSYVTRMGEGRTIKHLTYSDAMQRAHVMRARGYRVTITPTFVM